MFLSESLSNGKYVEDKEYKFIGEKKEKTDNLPASI